MANSKASIRYKVEEKKRRAIILAIILFIMGLAMIFMGTYAYYTKKVTGTVAGSVLAWQFKANDEVTSFTTTLAPSDTTTTLNSTMAPGTYGSFEINLATTVSATYTITFSNFINKPANLKFYSDPGFTTETDITASGYSITGSLANGGTVTKTIYWKWPLGTTASITNDNAAADKQFTFSVNVVGQQT